MSIFVDCHVSVDALIQASVEVWRIFIWRYEGQFNFQLAVLAEHHFNVDVQHNHISIIYKCLYKSSGIVPSGPPPWQFKREKPNQRKDVRLSKLLTITSWTKKQQSNIQAHIRDNYIWMSVYHISSNEFFVMITW